MIISVCDRVENIVRKGENAGYQHFLLSSQCFQKASFPYASKGVIIWEWVNLPLITSLEPFSHDRQGQFFGHLKFNKIDFCSSLYQMTKFWTGPN